MLEKKDIRKKAHRLIRKEKVDHQEAYDQLKREKSHCPNEEVADIVSKTPTDERQGATLGLRVIFVICLSLIFLLRTLDFVVSFDYLGVYNVVIYMFHGLILPPLGVYGALTGRTRFYRFIGVFMIISSVFYIAISIFLVIHWVALAVSIPFIVAAVLAFILPSKLKVPYKKKMVQREIRGRTVNVYEYFFNKSSASANVDNSDLLDL